MHFYDKQKPPAPQDQGSVPPNPLGQSPAGQREPWASALTGKNTQEVSWAPKWRTCVVKMPLLKASLFLSTFLNGF